MRKMTFNVTTKENESNVTTKENESIVTTKENESIVSLIKEVNNISCRIQFDVEKGIVIVENIDDTMIEFVINLINKYYNILNIIIDNTSDETVLVETSQSSADVDEQKSENIESVGSENKPTVVAPQSEDDLIIQKVEFRNKYVEILINKLMRTIYWAMYKMNVSEKAIEKYLTTFMSEISMKYGDKKTIKYSVGDIVDCNYGVHPIGEIQGGHVFGIVCNIFNDSSMAYVVPIIKARENLDSYSSYIVFHVPNDVVYNSNDKVYSDSGTALLDKGRYLRVERFHKVIGKTTPKFFAEVLKQLSTTFDFTTNIETTDNKSDVSTTEPKKTTKTKKVGTEKSALLNSIGDSLEKLDPTKNIGEQIVDFLNDIGMTVSETMIVQSFVIACNIKKITYENVILELHRMFPEVKEDFIKSVLKDNFKKWLGLHPELVESYPKISFMALLKIFAEKFS